jgi:16S rRNA (cytosine967-C5)-methyltransferase
MHAGMDRLGLAPRLIKGDASRPRDWWDGRPYDRVLVDAPCTASGVIRRHPDIKLLRLESDIAALASTQAEILGGAWQVLRPGGRLLYATCSIFPEENEKQIGAFLEQTPDASPGSFDGTTLPGIDRRVGRQILPGDAGMDGFYYACLTKTP